MKRLIILTLSLIAGLFLSKAMLTAQQESMSTAKLTGTALDHQAGTGFLLAFLMVAGITGGMTPLESTDHQSAFVFGCLKRIDALQVIDVVGISGPSFPMCCRSENVAVHCLSSPACRPCAGHESSVNNPTR